MSKSFGGSSARCALCIGPCAPRRSPVTRRIVNTRCFAPGRSQFQSNPRVSDFDRELQCALDSSGGSAVSVDERFDGKAYFVHHFLFPSRRPSTCLAPGRSFYAISAASLSPFAVVIFSQLQLRNLPTNNSGRPLSSIHHFLAVLLRRWLLAYRLRHGRQLPSAMGRATTISLRVFQGLLAVTNLGLSAYGRSRRSPYLNL